MCVCFDCRFGIVLDPRVGLQLCIHHHHHRYQFLARFVGYGCDWNVVNVYWSRHVYQSLRMILYRWRWLLIKASLCRQPSVASVYHSLEVHLSCEGVAEKTWELSKVISAHSPLLRCLDGSHWLAGQAVEGGGDGTLKGSRPYMGSTRPWSVPLNPSHLGT